MNKWKINIYIYRYRYSEDNLDFYNVFIAVNTFYVAYTCSRPELH